VTRGARKHGLAALASAALAVVGSCRAGAPDGSAPSFAPYGEDYRTKMDFARLEHLFPLTRRQLAALTPRNLRAMSQEQIDQVYARLTAGPVPDGAFEGTFFSASGGGLPRIAEVTGGLAGRLFTAQEQLFERLASTVWKGKVFDRGQRVQRNIIQDRLVLQALLPRLPIDVGRIPTTRINGRDVWLLLPARVYCGQSLLDGRRESIVIDHAFNDELAGYQAALDSLAGRNGARVRDEIRMVHPGLYLGRVYLARVFVFNFTLLNAEVERGQLGAFRETGRIEEDCRVGTQRTVAGD
jgi:hypothetical protein